jgi:GNAT superfamily N-acetyltransferase
MQIIDLDEKHMHELTHCLEEWSEEMKESGDHKERWIERMKDQGLGVKLALDEGSRAGGMIQYVPGAFAPVDGSDLYFILCIWVHGYKEGRGNYQKKGMGKALLHAAETDARSRGAGGMAAWGLSLPIWMKASWFKKQGYRPVDREGIRKLMWKSFDGEAGPPRWISRRKKPASVSGQVTVTAFLSGWCCSQNIVFERAKRAVKAFDDRVVFQAVDTFDRDTFLEWGISDAVYIDDKEITRGPPLSYDKIVKQIQKRLKKL